MRNWLAWKWIRGEKGEYFRKSLVLSLLITSIPSVFIGISSYAIGIDRVQKEVYRTHELKFEQFSDNMNKQFDQIAMVMSRWSANSMFDTELEHLDFINNIARMQEMMRALLVVGGSNLLIGDARLYLHSQKALIGNDGIYYLNPAQASAYASLLGKREGLFFAYDLALPGQMLPSPVSIVFKLPWHSDHPFGAFVLRLSDQEMQSMIRQANTEIGSYAFLMRKTGESVPPLTLNESETQLYDQLSKLVLEKEGQMASSSFTYKWRGEKYLISYGEVTKAQWVYVTATPLSQLAKPVVQTAKWILSISLLGLIVACVLAWFASNRLYRPIRQLVQLFRSANSGDPGIGAHEEQVKYELAYIEREWGQLTQERLSLQEKLKRSLPSLREGFLLQHVQGHLYAYDEAGLRDRMEQLGWDTQDKLFAIVFIQLSGLGAQTGRFQEDDHELISFAASNITEELARLRWQQSNVINFLDLSVGLMGLFPDSTGRSGVRDLLHEFTGELVAAIRKILGLQVTIIISRVTDRASDIPELFEQARLTARYRDRLADHQIMDMEEFSRPSHSQIGYPFALERELLHVMRLGLAEEVYGKYDAFLAAVQAEAEREMLVQQSMFQLLGSVRHLFIEMGLEQHPLLTEGQQFEELLGIREAAAIARWFKGRVITPFLEEFERTQRSHSRQLIERAVAYLKVHYAEELSLEICADQLSASPYTLSRSFKQVMGVNFVDYLLQLRIDRAKELLLGTELKINEVAERVGYQHSYFNKLFKGNVGLTPTQYRDQSRKEGK
ncbi:helix-turn-helix domain-containing protein [Paenibacillus ferrarius]|uniref:helix-turn-helix domain-containing protein n=1 Tax=Paenibacillus ferrarius TaxID=1469647 RepID=UPI003D281A19